MTSAIRASGRSTLLMTRMTGRFASSVLRSTNLVCGSGPSLASTSRTTPSTMDRPRSTSPPKSAWPGVSMMLIVSPLCLTAVFFARIVMPFSRSRSLESITRSLTWACAPNAPDCHSIASTSVVLPWSTCATMATLRMSSRVASSVAVVMVISCCAGMRESRSFGIGTAPRVDWCRGTGLAVAGPRSRHYQSIAAPQRLDPRAFIPALAVTRSPGATEAAAYRD